MAKIKYNSRKFLNKDSGISAIEVRAETLNYCAGIDASVYISDCHRSLCLDFGAYTKQDLNSRIKKLNQLIAELTKLQELFTTNYDAVLESFEVENNKLKKPKVVASEL